jgi:hypothetical protein
MSYDAWPSPDSRRGPLPRIEDLPVREQGYDQEAVRRAFDDFYRHAAQLDASLAALEAVSAFQRDAAQLRADLRALRTLGYAGGEPSWSTTSTFVSERLPSDVPVTAIRLTGEAGLLVAVAVVAGVAHLRAWTIVALMAAALAVVLLCEWLAARARTRVPASTYEGVAFASYTEVAAEPGEPAPYVEAPALDPGVGWSAFEPPAEEVAQPVADEPVEDTEEDVEPGAEVAGAAEPEQPAEPEQSSERAEPVQTPELEQTMDEPPPKRGWLRRRRDKPEDAAAEGREPAPEPTTHVRVLTPSRDAGGDDAPWERGFDGERDAND